MKIVLILLLMSASTLFGQDAAELKQHLNDAVQAAIEKFKRSGLKEDQVAVTLSVLGEGTNVSTASYRGDMPIYPASVVKMFYLEAAHRWLEEGKLKDTPELRRAMKDMIVDSYNEATHYILDLLTGTTSGPELSPSAMAEWSEKRNAVNRYFSSRGFEKINCNQKPWCEGPYGRDRIFVGEKYTNRNMLTTDATARLLVEIAQGRGVSRDRSAQMLELMTRDPFSPAKDPDDQAHGFTGPAVPHGSKLWSKAGWTSQTRHDAAFVELPNGRKVVLVIFTVGHATNREIIPAIARPVLLEFSK